MREGLPKNCGELSSESAARGYGERTDESLSQVPEAPTSMLALLARAQQHSVAWYLHA